jgi:hypothetical protein
MAFLVVGVNLTAFLIPDLLVGAIAKRLIFGEAAQADPNGFLLRLYLERSQVGFEDCAHCTMVKIKRKKLSSRNCVEHRATLKVVVGRGSVRTGRRATAALRLSPILRGNIYTEDHKGTETSGGRVLANRDDPCTTRCGDDEGGNWGVTRSVRVTRAARFRRSLSLPPLSIALALSTPPRRRSRTRFAPSCLSVASFTPRADG